MKGASVDVIIRVPVSLAQLEATIAGFLHADCKSFHQDGGYVPQLA